LRFYVAGDDQRIVNVPLAHVLNQRVHVAGFAAVPEREFIFRGSQAERTNHHRRERVREFALEHGAFTGDYAVVLVDLAEQHRRKSVGKMNLARALEIAARAVEVE
jgi:hypothetical protein